jgi:hypothetical protein
LDNQLQQQIMSAVPAIYLKHLSHRRLGFRGVTAGAMIAHLEQTYGVFTADHLEENLKKAEAPWDPNSPIETALDNILEAIAIAEAGADPISEQYATRIALKIFEQSGVMDDAVKDWRKKKVALRTWASIQTTFIAANKERIRLVSANELGFATANAAQGQQPPNNPAPNAARGNNNSNNNGGSKGYYCWSHGLVFNESHTSATCTNPAEGHEATATLGNMMGGNNMIRRKRNERQVFRRPTTQS